MLKQKEILKLAVPNIISNIAVPINGMIDMAIMGHMGKVQHIGALALGSLIFNFIYWNFFFLRMSSSGLTAQSYGAQNNHSIVAILYRALLLGITGGLIILLFRHQIFDFALYFIDGSSPVLTIAEKYFLIRIFDAPATIAIYALSGWFIGMQDSFTPMFSSILISFSNILFSLIFVFGFDMLIDGVAYGTVIAQYLGLTYLIITLLRKHKNLLETTKVTFQEIRNGFKSFFKINADVFLRTFMVIIVMSFFTSKSASQSDEILAINSILLQYFLIFSFFIDGFAYAAESLVGKFVGAKNDTNLKLAIKYIFMWSFIISTLITLIFLIQGNAIMHLLTNDHELITKSKEYMIWIQFIPIISFAAFTWDGIYIGATLVRTMRNSLFFSSVFFFTSYFILFPLLGNHGIWLSFYIYLTTRGFYQWYYSKKIRI